MAKSQFLNRRKWKPRGAVKLRKEGRYIFVGRYPMWSETAALIADTEDGNGSFGLNPDKKLHRLEGVGSPHIVVGLRHERWWAVVEILQHEVAEFAYARLGLRYNFAEEQCSDSHASYSFFMTHEQFTEAQGRIACFITPALPDLADVWNEWRQRSGKPRAK